MGLIRAFGSTVVITIFLLSGYLIQNKLIYPAELLMRTAESVQLYSLCYIPHGLKAICFGILGFWAALPVFIAQAISGTLIYGNDVFRSVEGGLIGTSAFIGALILFNYFRRKDIFGSIITFSFNSSNRPLILLFFTVWATVVNSIISGVYWSSSENMLFLKFAVGDLIGAMVATMGLLIVRHWLFSRVKGEKS